MHIRTCANVVVLLIAALAAGCGSRPETRPPDIVLIVIDTLRLDDVGCYGAARPTTPNIDALAARGARFARAYSPSPWTMPAVASMFTGLHPSTHGIRTVRHRLPEELTTLAEVLSENGYACWGVISHALISTRYGFDQGFDLYFQDEAGEHDHVSTAGVTRRAIDLIERAAASRRDDPDGPPFFLFAHYFDPHYDWIRHPEVGFASPSAGRLDGSQGILELRDMAPTLTVDELRFLRDLYDEEIRHTDAGVGRLLARLDALGLADDAVVVLVADHGEAFMDHGWLGHTQNLHEELVHVPLIVRAPGVAAGSVVPGPAATVALAPTLLDLAGVERAPAFQAASLVPRLNPDGGADAPAVLSEVDFTAIRQVYSGKNAYQKALIGDRYKLIRDDPTGSVQLYDLRDDPTERRNLAVERSEIVQRMLPVLDGLLAELRRGSRDPEEIQLTPKQIEALRSLGYVGR